MKEKRNNPNRKWTRTQKIAVCGVIIAALGIILELVKNASSRVSQSVGSDNQGTVVQQSDSPNSPITLNPAPDTAEKFLKWADFFGPSVREKVARGQYKFGGFLNAYHLGEIQRIANEDGKKRITVTPTLHFGQASIWPPDEFGDAPKPNDNGYDYAEVSGLVYVIIEVNPSVFGKSSSK